MSAHRLIVVSGLAASGNTRVGRLLSEHLRMPLIDKDAIFKYGRYYVTCYEGYPGVASHYYETRPTSWAAGQRTRYPSAPAASKCVPQPKGSSFTKHTTKAVTWTNGPDLSATIGIDLSTRTGYSGDAEVKFTFNRNRRLCGTGDYPGGTPYQLRAKMPA